MFIWAIASVLARIISRLAAKAAWGVVLFVPFLFVTGLAELGFRGIGLTSPSTPLPSFLEAKDIPQVVLALILVSVVAVAEETVFRGYLLLRFCAISRNSAYGVLWSSLVFALGHGYEGTAGLATVAVMGAPLGVYLSLEAEPGGADRHPLPSGFSGNRSIAALGYKVIVRLLLFCRPVDHATAGGPSVAAERRIRKTNGIAAVVIRAKTVKASR